MVDLVAAGVALKAWLEANEKSQTWLVEEINRRRATAEKLGRSNLWRWMTGEQRINNDDATLIQAITSAEGTQGPPVLATQWSRHADLLDA